MCRVCGTQRGVLNGKASQNRNEYNIELNRGCYTTLTSAGSRGHHMTLANNHCEANVILVLGREREGVVG